MNSTESTKNKSWEKQFDENFFNPAVPNPTELKSFIAQAIAEAVEAEELKYLRRFEQKADEVRNKAILEERRRIVSRIEEEKSKGYEANTILEGLIAELKIGSLINQKNV